MNFDLITSKITDSDSLDFGEIFNRSFELFKKVWLQGFIVVLLTIVLVLPIYFIIYIPMFVFGFQDPEMLRTEELSPAFIAFMAIAYPIIMLVVMSVSLAMNAAFLRICRQQDLKGSSEDNYFYYFKKEYLGKLLLLSLIIFGLAILGMLMCGVGLIYMIVPLSLIPAFFAFDTEMEPMEMVKSAFSLGNKNWLVIFGLILLMGIIAEFGILLCFVGIFFTAMLARIPIYFMYKDAIGFPLEE